MPVAVPPIDRQVDPSRCQLRREYGQQVANLLIDRADATEMLVMFGHFQHSFPGDIPPPQHVLQKRQDLVGTLRPSETDNQDGIVIVRQADVIHP